MRVALISHVVGFGDGQGRVNYEIVRTALEAGAEVTVIAERCADDLAKHERVRFVSTPTSRLPIRFLKNLSFAVRSALWLKRNRKSVDLVQGNGFITFARAEIVAAHFVHGAWLKSPYASFAGRVMNIHTLYQKIYTKLNARLEQTAFRKAAKIVAVSQNVAYELMSVGVSADKIEVIFNGVDTEEFMPREGNRGAFGLPESKVIFLFAGDIRTSRKNLDGVLHAVAQIDGIHLAVAGALEESPFPPLTEKLGIVDRVHFLGKTKRMADLMNAVDAFIFPSRYDPMGLVVTEAMASGLPVITSKTTGAYAVLDEADWTVNDPENVADLARKMRMLAGDAALRQQLGELNRAKALHHTWAAMAAAYLRLYERITPSAPQARSAHLDAYPGNQI